MPHEIHVSERRSFRGCRRRWNWAYRDGFVPDTPIKPLEFGVAYHAALEVFYNPETWKTLSLEEKLRAAVKVFQEKCEEQRDNYLRVMNVRTLPLELEVDYEDRTTLGIGMLEYHARFVSPKFDNWFRPVLVEIPFEVPLEDPDNPGNPLRCTNSPLCGQKHSNDPNDDGSVVVCSGRVDMLVEDILNGGYFVWDHKTAAQLASDEGFLQLDDQIGTYVWALRYKLGLDIRGFIYAESRKDYPREPKALKRLSGGRSFSTAQNQPTSIEIFEPFVAKHDRPAYEDGAYDAYIEWLKSSEATQYHQRFPVIKSEAELIHIGENIAMEAADMVNPKTRIYPSVGRYSCSNCAFRQPCLGMFMDEDVQYLLESTYIKTDRKYWETVPPSSEKSGK
jgi:hypothetical protein